MSWPVVKLGDVVNFIGGSQPPKTDFVYEEAEGYIRLIQTRDYKSDKYLTYIPIEKSRRFCNKEDVMIGRYGPPVFQILRGIEGSYNVALMKAEPTAVVDREYLYYFLKQDVLFKLIDGLSQRSSGQTGIDMDALKAYPMLLPPLKEQKRIAAILDKADGIRRKRQQAIQLADDFLRSVFLDMFGDPVTNPKGWRERVLKDVADIRSGVTKGKKIDPDTSVTLPYMRVANVQDGYLKLDDIQLITVSPNDAKKCKLASGDILLTEGGDPDKLGRGHIWNNEVEDCIHQNHIFSVRIKNTEYVRPAFLSALIASQRGKRYFLKVGKQTTGIATINKTVLSEFLTFVPDIDVQDKYLSVLKKVNALKVKNSYGDLDLFDSLSQRAFTGKI